MSLTVNANCWHALPMGIPATLDAGAGMLNGPGRAAGAARRGTGAAGRVHPAVALGLPPLLIQAGTSQLLAPDAELLAARAAAAGADVTYTRWPRMWHDFMSEARPAGRRRQRARAGRLVRRPGHGRRATVTGHPRAAPAGTDRG